MNPERLKQIDERIGPIECPDCGASAHEHKSGAVSCSYCSGFFPNGVVEVGPRVSDFARHRDVGTVTAYEDEPDSRKEDGA